MQRNSHNLGQTFKPEMPRTFLPTLTSKVNLGLLKSCCAWVGLGKSSVGRAGGSVVWVRGRWAVGGELGLFWFG